MQQIFDAVAHNIAWSMIFGLIGLGIVLSTVRRIVIVRSQERTRREIAAYIAEGSMTPEEGERILTAKPRGGGCCGGSRRRVDASTGAPA